MFDWPRYYPGQITKVRGVKYDIKFDDGDHRCNVRKGQIRSLENKNLKTAEEGAASSEVGKESIADDDGADVLVNTKAQPTSSLTMAIFISTKGDISTLPCSLGLLSFHSILSLAAGTSLTNSSLNRVASFNATVPFTPSSVSLFNW